MQQVHFKLGSDPELMLRDKVTKELRSAIPVIEEGKGAGRPLDESGQNTVLHDNVLVEFNTRPALERAEFVQTIGSVLKKIDALVLPHGLELHLQASADFPTSELNCLEAQIFGCDPDYDAYILDRNEMPAEAAQQPFRSAGGHLHVGVDERDEKVRALLDDPYGKIRVVKALDLTIGIPSVLLDKDPTAVKRRSLYGRAGSHRPKDYGVEYRASGNWWLSSPIHTDLVHRLTEVALGIALDEKELENLIQAVGGEKELQEVINDSAVDRAGQMFRAHIKAQLDAETASLVEKLERQESYDFRAAWQL